MLGADAMTEHIGPDDAAACLLTHLEAKGAIFTINEAGHLHADLDAIPHLGNIDPATMIGAVLSLAPQIKRILRARGTVHYRCQQTVAPTIVRRTPSHAFLM
jgi:hypothetical protein